MADKESVKQAKEYLAQIRKIDRMINCLLLTEQNLKFNLISPSNELNPDKVQTSGEKDSFGRTMAKILDLNNNITACTDDLADRKAAALSRINKLLDLDQQSVLIARYVNGKKWGRIAVDLNFSIAQVYRIHGAALLDFAEKNPDILKDDSK